MKWFLSAFYLTLTNAGDRFQTKSHSDCISWKPSQCTAHPQEVYALVKILRKTHLLKKGGCSFTSPLKEYENATLLWTRVNTVALRADVAQFI